MAMDTAMEDMDTMDMAMARGRLRPMLMLPQDTIIMVMDTAMVVMDTMDMVMARERPRLRLDTIITDTPTDMVAMDIMDTVMARGRLSPVIIMDTPMGMAIMDMVVMDTMVKQQLFICHSNFSKFDLDLPESSQKKHTPDIKKYQNSLFEIKDKTNRMLCIMFEISFMNVQEVRLKQLATLFKQNNICQFMPQWLKSSNFGSISPIDGFDTIYILSKLVPTVTMEAILTGSLEYHMEPCPTEPFSIPLPRPQSDLIYRWENQGDVMPKFLQNVTMFPKGCK